MPYYFDLYLGFLAFMCLGSVFVCDFCYLFVLLPSRFSKLRGSGEGGGSDGGGRH